jgi:hypothetical protein
MTATATQPRTARERLSVLSLLWTDGSPHRWLFNIATWAAAALMVVSGYIHLHLWDIAYRNIATIGSLFVVQGVAAFVFALAAAVFRRVWTALIGAGTMIATLTGFLISVNYGLFGFQDSFSGSNAIDAFVVEIASAILFLTAVAISIAGRTTRFASAGGPLGPEHSSSGLEITHRGSEVLELEPPSIGR